MTNMIQDPDLSGEGITLYNATVDDGEVVFNGGSTPSWIQFALNEPMVGGNQYTLTLDIANLSGGVNPQIRLPAGSVSGHYNLVDGANQFTCRNDLDDYSVLHIRGSGGAVTARLSNFSLTE